jgi:hypothetical protein
MADDSTVTIRHKTTGAERTVEKDAVPFFPDFDVLTKDGRVNPKATTTTKTEN